MTSVRAALAAALLACAAPQTPANHADTAAPVRDVANSANDSLKLGPRVDCLGDTSPPAIALGQVGRLHLDVPLRTLHRLCPATRDSTAIVDESMDTTVVFSRPGLTLVGHAADIDDSGERKAYHADSSRSIDWWTIRGTSGTLPGGVPLTATFDSLVRAYGEPALDPNNDDVYIRFCPRLPVMVFHMVDPVYYAKDRSATARRAALARSHIVTVDVPSSARALSSYFAGPCKADK